MIDRKYDHPTSSDDGNVDQRRGIDRRKVHTTLEPDKDRRKRERRRK